MCKPDFVVAASPDNSTVLRHLGGSAAIPAPPLVLVPTGTFWTPLADAAGEGRVIVRQAPVSPEAYHAETAAVTGSLPVPWYCHTIPPLLWCDRDMHSMVFLGLPSSLTLLHDYLSLFATSHPQSLSLLVLTDATPLERYVLRYPAVYRTPGSKNSACSRRIPGGTAPSPLRFRRTGTLSRGILHQKTRHAAAHRASRRRVSLVRVRPQVIG